MIIKNLKPYALSFQPKTKVMKLFNVYPINEITITRARGSYLWDDAGQQYLDMYGGHAVISIGHTHPHFVSRITHQLNQVAFYSNSIRIPLQHELADKLGKVSGKDEFQLFLCNSGAEANENAMKLASFHTGRKKIVAFSKSFHGRTSLAVAATDNPAIIAPVNQTGNVVFLPFNDADALIKYFNEHGRETAAVIIEGIQGVGGINVAEISFLQKIRTLCTDYDVIFIADEVQCGYGRTGAFFSQDLADVQADIYSLAKGMGNGFPIGGILIAPFLKPKYGMLGTTFGGNHLACAAALAVLEVIEEERLMENAISTGDFLMSHLKKIKGLNNVRGKGLMIGFDVEGDLKDLRKNLLDNQQVFTGEAKPNTIRLLPSLALRKKEAAEFLESLEEEIRNMASTSKLLNHA
jgi:acetylornithine/N-succinyldiaminopimelate aminotransferase